MARRKQSAETEEKFRLGEEALEVADSLLVRFQTPSSLNKNEITEVKNNLATMRKIKDGFDLEPPVHNSILEMRRKLEQKSEDVKKILISKAKGFIEEADKNAHCEKLEALLKQLNEKAIEMKNQIETLSIKKKGKNQNKMDKLEKFVENITSHIQSIEKVLEIAKNRITYAQEESIKDLLSHFEAIFSNNEFSMTAIPLDHLYNSFDTAELDAGQPSSDNSHSGDNAETTKEPESTKPIQEKFEPKNFSSRARLGGFEHEKKRIPKLSEKDFKSDYNFFDIFEASARNMPKESDYYPTPITKERVGTKTVYPKKKFIDEHIFEKLDVDTLFFIFYFQKGTYEQYLAAKELKRRAWRFHKKYLTWFKRLEAPRVTNDDYEQGTYAFFDFEPGGWCQRKKNDFTFKYSYLEDEKL